MHRAGLIVFFFAALSACHRDPASIPISGSPVVLDPGLVYRDSALFADIAGNGRGLVKLGEGWYQQRYRSKIERWQLDSWVGGAPSLYFLGPFEGQWDLVLHCAPFSHPGGEEQTLTPVLNGVELPTIRLESGFQDLRINLPDQHLKRSINELVLRFAWTVIPRKIGKGDEHRGTAAKVSSVRMAPRGLKPAVLQSRASILLDDAQEVVLRPGSPIAFPLDGRSGSGLELVSVDGANPEDELIAEVMDYRGERQLLYQAHPDDLRGITLGCSPHSAPPSYLILSSKSHGGSDLRLGLKAVESGHGAGRQIDKAEPDGAQNTASAEDQRRVTAPNIFIYTVDTLRADALGAYGYHRATSPHIDAFAAEAMTFVRTWSPSPYTPPATMSLLTGLYPFHHGFVHSGHRPSGSLSPLLSERLHDVGYETVAISQSYNIGPLYTFERGFESFYSNDAVARGGSESADVPWFLWNHIVFRPHPIRPLFVYIHVVDTHQPYKPQAADREFAKQNRGSLRDWKYFPEYFMENRLEGDDREVAHMRALYDGEVLRADRQFGRFIDLLKSLDLYESSLVILTADHGEEFAEHRGFGHTRTLYEELLHVPLLVKLPGARHAGRMIDTRASLIDVVPTVLELAGVDAAGIRLDGTSLTEPDLLDSERTLLAETNPWIGEPKDSGSIFRRIDLRAAVNGDLKCIENRLGWNRFGQPEEQLQAFDLAVDPTEQVSLDPGDRDAKQCAPILRRYFEQDSPAGGAMSESLSEEDRASLRALGYLE